MKKIIWLLAALLLLALTGYSALGGADNAWSRRLCAAIDAGDTERAIALMDEGMARGYSMDTLDHPHSFLNVICEIDRTTPLANAIRAGDVDSVRALLERGACPNEFGSTGAGGKGNGEAPLSCVLSNPLYARTDMEMLRLLLAYGADFSAGSVGTLCAMMAAHRRVDDSRQPEGENTPENVAAGVTEVFRFVAEHVDVHEKWSGWTVLHMAAIRGNWLLCRVLVEEYGLDISARVYDGRSAYDMALERNAPEDVLELLYTPPVQYTTPPTVAPLPLPDRVR
ncbi:MAG: ankyrin repeat domain-containing protein [Clostridia bacterium]|nr:ankyrin repeat domain-containing protein [Clostridia bacterium]